MILYKDSCLWPIKTADAEIVLHKRFSLYTVNTIRTTIKHDDSSEERQRPANIFVSERRKAFGRDIDG